jgi:hypothetical protein
MIQTAARSIYRAPMFAAVIPTCAFIPPITDPQGRSWRQPDMATVEFDDTHVLLTQAQFDGLPEYSTTTPTGVYVGKCWKAQELIWPDRHGGFPKATGKWFLRWFGESEIGPGYCSNHQREIIIT